MKIFQRSLIVLFALCAVCLGGFETEISAQNANPTLLKRTVNVSVKRYLRYWKNPQAAEPVYNTYSWIPQIRFDVLGALPAGGQLYADFETADGKPWLTYKMRTHELADDVSETILIEDTLSDAELEKKAVVTEGVYGFRIRLTGVGAERILLSGKYRVGTYPLDQKIPENKNKKDFYFDFDWQIPFGYLWLNPQNDNENMPSLASLMCFRGANDYTKFEAVLFYNGKEIDKSGVNAANRLKQTMTSAADEASHRWTMWQFDFPKVRGFDLNRNSANNVSAYFFLDKNPGQYEIKVSRDGAPARSMKFAVGKDGKIVDNGIKDKNQLGGVRMIFPVGVIGAADGKWNAAAWKTDGLYGNLAGFAPVQ